MHLHDSTEQTKIDNFMVQELDGTINEWGWCKQKVLQFILQLVIDQTKVLYSCDPVPNNYFVPLYELGANAILVVSLAVCKAGASIPLCSHAGNKLAMQEFMILPV
ncbi:hypothetical protein Ccrd_018730 [Cynara cardunculus var. scolymus]|uniref:Uncharacterized protein n=1 Tax=Cynara cardunculus var. scolymus TaxID=59895 RepID=A0A103Y5Q3_CYNCS|nr:hypothetical protein Ccrd_018730 [Cynara cardunculus var. scolymus]